MRDRERQTKRIRPGVRTLLAATLLAGVLAGCGSSATLVSVNPIRHVEGWPYIGRDRQNDRYATQAQIDTSNVKRLGLAWRTSLGEFQDLLETFPLVTGNTIYATTSTDVVEALNATTGKVLWTYAPEVEFNFTTGVGGLGVSTNRGLAESNGHLFLVTFNDHLQSISASTGEEQWQSEVIPTSSGVFEDMAPTVYGGMVFVGGSGGEDGVRGFISAFSEKTGKKLWTFYTIPKRGEGWVCATNCGGGTIYNAPTVDEKTGVIYMGTGSPAPTVVDEKRGSDLYTASIIALKASTGKLLWYHQEVADDVFGYAPEQPVVLLNTIVNGKTVEAVAETNKDGYVYVLNAKTGAELFSPPAVVREQQETPTVKGTKECPGPAGGVHFAPLAFDPETADVYVSAANVCETVTVIPGCKLKEGVHRGETDFCAKQEVPPSEHPLLGTFTAVNVTNGDISWQKTMPTPMLGGSAASAGGLVFTGDQHGTLYAFNAQSGQTLWQGNLGLAFGTAPEIYEVDHQEYVLAAIGGSAVTVGLDLGPVGAELVALKLGGSHLPGSP